MANDTRYIKVFEKTRKICVNMRFDGRIVTPIKLHVDSCVYFDTVENKFVTDHEGGVKFEGVIANNASLTVQAYTTDEFDYNAQYERMYKHTTNATEQLCKTLNREISGKRVACIGNPTSFKIEINDKPFLEYESGNVTKLTLYRARKITMCFKNLEQLVGYNLRNIDGNGRDIKRLYAPKCKSIAAEIHCDSNKLGNVCLDRMVRNYNKKTNIINCDTRMNNDHVMTRFNRNGVRIQTQKGEPVVLGETVILTRQQIMLNKIKRVFNR